MRSGCGSGSGVRVLFGLERLRMAVPPLAARWSTFGSCSAPNVYAWRCRLAGGAASYVSRRAIRHEDTASGVSSASGLAPAFGSCSAPKRLRMEVPPCGRRCAPRSSPARPRSAFAWWCRPAGGAPFYVLNAANVAGWGNRSGQSCRLERFSHCPLYLWRNRQEGSARGSRSESDAPRRILHCCYSVAFDGGRCRPQGRLQWGCTLRRAAGGGNRASQKARRVVGTGGDGAVGSGCD